MDDIRRQIEVNMFGHVAVTKAMLPSIRRARGRIVFISSIGGRIAFPMNGPYHLAKFGIEAMGDVFRQELRPWGISVSIVEPGSIATPIWERSEREIDALLERSPATAELYGEPLAAVRRASSEGRRAAVSRPIGSPTGSSTPSPLAGPAAATWSAWTPSRRRGQRSSSRRASGTGSSLA